MTPQMEIIYRQMEAQLLNAGCTMEVASDAAKDLANGMGAQDSQNISDAYEQILAARLKVGDRCSFNAMRGQVATGEVTNVVRSGGEYGFNIYTVLVDSEHHDKVYDAKVTLTHWNVRFLALNSEQIEYSDWNAELVLEMDQAFSDFEAKLALACPEKRKRELFSRDALSSFPDREYFELGWSIKQVAAMFKLHLSLWMDNVQTGNPESL